MLKKAVLGFMFYLPLLVNANNVGIDSLNKEMTFRMVTPCIGNAASCESFILAQGKITKKTPEIFSKFLNENPARKIALDSNGGDFRSSLELANIVFDNNLETYLSNEEYSEEIMVKRELINIPLSLKPQCRKECGYVFLGGIVRGIDENALFSIAGLLDLKPEIKKEVMPFLSSIGFNDKLLKKLQNSTSSSEMIFSHEDLTNFNIENKTKREFEWIFDMKNGILQATKAIHLEGARGRLLVVVKREGDIFQIKFFMKPRGIIQIKDLSAFSAINFKSTDGREKSFFESQPTWSLNGNIMITEVKIKNADKIFEKQKSIGVDVTIPNYLNDFSPNTDFYLNDVFKKIRLGK